MNRYICQDEVICKTCLSHAYDLGNQRYLPEIFEILPEAGMDV